MRSTLAQRIARLHPALFTVLAVAIALLQASASKSAAPFLYGILIALPFALVGGWAWAVREISNRDGSSGWKDALYAAPTLLAIIAGWARWPTHNSPAALAVLGLLFAGLWIASSALENANAPDGRASFGWKVGTMLVMFFYFLAPWVLRAKIIHAVDRAAASA